MRNCLIIVSVASIVAACSSNLFGRPGGGPRRFDERTDERELRDSLPEVDDTRADLDDRIELTGPMADESTGKSEFGDHARPREVPSIYRQGATTITERAELQNQHWQTGPRTEGAEPFTPAWYDKNPQAWRPADPRASSWAFTNFDKAVAWLDLPADTEAIEPSSTDSAADDARQESSTGAKDESSLAIQPAAPETTNDEWLGLGVYKLMPTNQKKATALVQLAISREGAVRGSYYDLLADQSYAVKGSVDKQTQRIVWTTNSEDSTKFTTTLRDLTRPGDQPVELQLSDGETRQWHLWRQDAPGQK